jgi:predicted nucleotidyltransferase
MFVPKKGAGLRLSIASELCEKNRMKTLDQRLLDTATRRLVVEFQPEQVWLYGSHAWGQPHADSDVDLLVVVPHSDESPIRRSQRAHRCLRGLRMPKDVLVETRQEVDRVRDLTTSLENTILTRGRRLYG